MHVQRTRTHARYTQVRVRKVKNAHTHARTHARAQARIHVILKRRKGLTLWKSFASNVSMHVTLQIYTYTIYTYMYINVCVRARVCVCKERAGLGFRV